jgi:hypothetical protein
MAELNLTDHQRDNLLSLLIAVSGLAGPSPLCAANTGDWVLELAGDLGWCGPAATNYGHPNAKPTELAMRARRWSRQ